MSSHLKDHGGGAVSDTRGNEKKWVVGLSSNKSREECPEQPFSLVIIPCGRGGGCVYYVCPHVLLLRGLVGCGGIWMQTHVGDRHSLSPPLRNGQTECTECVTPHSTESREGVYSKCLHVRKTRHGTENLGRTEESREGCSYVITSHLKRKKKKKIERLNFINFLSPGFF